MDATNDRLGPPTIGLVALFLKFLKFGALAFGGPVAQIAMIRHALVEDERWIDPARFNRLLAVLQILPGPEAHELCVHFGMIARGRWGGLLAGLGFMLPGLLLMLAAGWFYVTWLAVRGDWSGVLMGIQIVVLAIILRAVVRIGQHILEDRMTWAIALASLAATAAGVPFWIPLLAGGFAHALAQRPPLVVVVAAFALAIAVASLLFGASLPTLATGTGTGGPATLPALFFAGLKGGLLTFGGAYTAIPYVRADTVGRGWIGDAAFLDGIAISGVLPAPLVIFATFVGYVVGGLGGALAITAGMFLPAFAFSLVLYERLEAVVHNEALHRLLGGIAAAVVGIIAATWLQLGEAAQGRMDRPLVALVLFTLALVAIWRIKGTLVMPALLLVGGVAGRLLLE